MSDTKALKPVRLGIIGLNFGVHAHLPAFRTIPGVTIEAISGSSLEKSQAIAEAQKIPHAYGDWNKLLEDPNIDAVTVAVPPALQGEVALAVARAGKHLFCEKPLAAKLSTAKEIVETAKKTRIVHVMDFILAEIPEWQLAKELIANEEIGEVRSLQHLWHIETVSSRFPDYSWKKDPEVGGGTLFNFAPHTLYGIEWLLGNVTSLTARLHEEGAFEFGVDTLFEFENGARATSSILSNAYLGEGHRLTFYGSGGTMVLENRGDDHVRGFSLYVAKRGDKTFRQIMPSVTVPEDGDGRIFAIHAIATRFIDAIRGTAIATPGLETGLRVQQLVDASIESNKNGTRIEVPLQ